MPEIRKVVTMKLKEGIMITEVSEQKMLVDTGSSGECFQGIIKVNETGALVAETLQKETTMDELVQLFVSEYGITDDVARADISVFIDQLRETGILEG